MSTLATPDRPSTGKELEGGGGRGRGRGVVQGEDVNDCLFQVLRFCGILCLFRIAYFVGYFGRANQGQLLSNWGHGWMGSFVWVWCEGK